MTTAPEELHELQGLVADYLRVRRSLGYKLDDAEYILSTFKGIHDGTTLLRGHPSFAEHILGMFDRLASDARGRE